MSLDEKFYDEYVEQVMKATKILHEKLFPERQMKIVENLAKKAIKDGKNTCIIHSERKTTLLIYPDLIWSCEECNQKHFEKGYLGNGHMVFDMKKEKNNEGDGRQGACEEN